MTAKWLARIRISESLQWFRVDEGGVMILRVWSIGMLNLDILWTSWSWYAQQKSNNDPNFQKYGKYNRTVYRFFLLYIQHQEVLYWLYPYQNWDKALRRGSLRERGFKTAEGMGFLNVIKVLSPGGSKYLHFRPAPRRYVFKGCTHL